MNIFWKLFTIGTLIITSTWGTSIAVCKGCHGQQWEDKAMGKSKVVKNMSKVEIINALKGYKNGSYGGVMKGLMVEQVKETSIAEMDALAEEIKK